MATESRVPWDFSLPKDDGSDVPNEPSPEGALLGRKLAAIVRVEESRLEMFFPERLPRCDDCALTAGTIPNRCLGTLGDVVKCVAEARPFYCHKGTDDGAKAPKRLCAGYVTLLSVLGGKRGT